MNTVIIVPFYVCFIGSNFKKWCYYPCLKDDNLVILREMKMSSLGIASSASVAACRFFDRTGFGTQYSQQHILVVREFNNHGFVKGYEILNTRTLDKLWMSYQDLVLFDSGIFP